MATICYANTIDFDHALQQRPHHIMSLLAERGHQVFWVNQSQSNDRFRTKINDNLTIYHNWEKFCNKYKGQIDVYFSSWSHRWNDIEKLNPKMVIYDSLDMFPANQSQEENMVKRSDIIFTTTKNIMEFQKQHTDKPIYLCENGCFPKYRSQEYDIPEDIKDLPKPWILFSGALAINKDNGWVDFDLIKKISDKYTLIVIGKLWDSNQDQLLKLKKRKIKFIDAKDYETLQKYYAHCCINILPFRRCQTSDYSFPLKVVEGCNHGKICVATDIPVMVDMNKKYPNAVLTSRNSEQFIENIKIALKNADNKQAKNECYALADEHDWEKKVDIIEKGIGGFL